MEHLFRRMVCTSCGHTIDVPISCGFRFCPVCSVGRQMKVRDRLKWLIDNCEKPKGHFFAHLTATISNEQDLANMVKHIMLSFRKLRNRAYWKSKVHGGAFVVEVTGHPGNWHAHIHAIICTRWMDWDHLMRDWTKCSGSRGIMICKIPVGAAVNYLTKYLTKNETPEVVLHEISNALRGSRLFAPIGSWFNINKTYKRSPSPCPECGGHHWQDYNGFLGCWGEPLYKDVGPPGKAETTPEEVVDYFMAGVVTSWLPIP